MNKSKATLFSFFLASAIAAQGQVTLNVDVNHPGIKVSPNLYGIFFEDINHAADGGLYAELIRNRSFEDNVKQPDSWSVSGDASMQLVDKQLLNTAQHRALQVTFKGQGALTNTGYWGINSVTGRTYKLSLWAKGKLKGGLKAQLVSADGSKVYAEAPVNGQLSGKWSKLTAEFTATANDPRAAFRLVSAGKGTVTFDVVSLFPPTFNNRPNGLRPDLASMLEALHPKFVRFPGGCFVEGQQSPENAFHWERSVGPIETRPGHANVNWGYRTTDGMGFHEYLQLAEDLHAKPLYVVNVGIWHGGFTPVDSIQPWIDECLNALEYANGPVTSKYGAMRARNGHPEPFNIEYLEIGNENNQHVAREQSDHYYDRYKKFRDAVLARYPKMHIIGDVVAWGDDNPKWESSLPVDFVDEHYYRTPAWFADAFHKYDSYPRTGHKVYVGEYAVTQGFGTVGNLNAALGEAVYMMGMERNSDVVGMCSYAPIFCNLNNVAWRPDMIQFESDRALGTPSYYVQKLMANNVGTRVLSVAQNDPYTQKLQQEQVSPAEASFGVSGWGTKVSFQTPETLKAVSGKWDVTGNQAAKTDYAEGTLAVSGVKHATSDVTYKVRARKDDGNEGFMVVFNYTDPNNYCWVNFGGWGNTQNAIEQVVDGSKQVTITKPGKIEKGRWYDVTVHQMGDSIEAYLDNKLVLATRLKHDTSFGVYSNATLDETTGTVIVKVVNTGKQATTALVTLDGAQAGNATVTRLYGNGSDENTIDNATHVVPQTATLSPEGNKVSVYVPANSLNIIRIKKN